MIVSVQNYIKKMIEDCGTGMKALLMDKETTGIVSIVFAQSEMLQHEVYLFERLDAEKPVSDELPFVKCIVFVRPTKDNIGRLCRELHRPRYASYFINFSGVVSKADVKMLAEADQYELVSDVQEIYADYTAVAPHAFHLNLPDCSLALRWQSGCLQRSVQGIAGVLLSLKIQPVIRYQASSDMARKLAEDVKQLFVSEQKLFSFRRGDPPPVLLIVDRRDDAVTPLLNQWTYQAMMHEFLTIKNNRISLADVPNVPAELKEVVMSPENDQFYAKNMYMNFGEIGQTIKDLMDEYQRRVQNQKKVESINDMKQFVEIYPQFKKFSGTVTKHVTVVSELSRLVNAHSMMEVSEIEQQLVCNDEHQQTLQGIYRLIRNKTVRDSDAAKLVYLYALRYETHASNDISGLLSALRKRFGDQEASKLTYPLLDYGGVRARSSDLFGSSDPVAVTKRFFQGIKGVDNIYTQHKPLLSSILDNLVRGKLRESAYPFINSSDNKNPRVSTVIVFIVGGITYEEILSVHQLNVTLPSVRTVLGGTFLHNSRSFLHEVAACMATSTQS